MNKQRTLTIEEKEPPEFVLSICHKLGVQNQKQTIYAYDWKIYNPHKVQIDPPLMQHEVVHCVQQEKMNILGRFGARRWWRRYAKDKQFRYEQELEAYRAQYQMMSKHIKDRNQLNNFLVAIAGDLAGPMYGGLTTLSKAMEDIRKQ